MTAIGALNGNPALAVMQSMVVRAEQPRGEEGSQPSVMGSALQAQQAETAEASDEFYFGTQMTVTKLMFFMMEKVVSYLNGKLDTGADGNEAAEEAGNRWRKQALQDEIPVNSKDDFRLPEPGENGVTFREVANTIKSRFNMSFLARDGEFTRMLEKLVGFRLPGLDMADIIEAFVDPDSDSAERLRDAIEDGLAGQEGSKVSQRLERVADGPQSVSELAAKKRSPADVVDEETLAEDKQALEAARMQERLGGIREMLDGIGEAVKARGGDATSDPDGAQHRIDDAMAIIQRLSGAAPEEASVKSAETPRETDTAEASGEAEDAPADADATLQNLEEDLAAAEADRSRHATLAEVYADEASPDEREADFRFTI